MRRETDDDVLGQATTPLRGMLVRLRRPMVPRAPWRLDERYGRLTRYIEAGRLPARIEKAMEGHEERWFTATAAERGLISLHEPVPPPPGGLGGVLQAAGASAAPQPRPAPQRKPHGPRMPAK